MNSDLENDMQQMPETSMEDELEHAMQSSCKKSKKDAQIKKKPRNVRKTQRRARPYKNMAPALLQSNMEITAGRIRVFKNKVETHSIKMAKFQEELEHRTVVDGEIVV